MHELFGDRVEWRTLTRDVLEVTAFAHPQDYARHFTAYYGPTIAARANAAREGREAELDEALERFCEEWDRGTADAARFEMEYLVAVGTRCCALWAEMNWAVMNAATLTGRPSPRAPRGPPSA